MFGGRSFSIRFYPNDDGINDLFKAIVHQKVISFKLQIFNREGQLLFQTSEPAKGWDGMSVKGIPYPASVFVSSVFTGLPLASLNIKKGRLHLFAKKSMG